MDRPAFVLGVAKGRLLAVLGALGAQLVQRDQAHIVWTRADGEDLDICLRRLEDDVSLPGLPSAGTGQLWTIYLCLPDHAAAVTGRAIFRRLRRAVLAPANTNAQGERFAAGPWSPRAIWRARPALAERWFKRADGSWGLPIVFAGEGPEAAAEVDYDPTDADCAADVDAP